jgi:hypothetical protein
VEALKNESERISAKVRPLLLSKAINIDLAHQVFRDIAAGIINPRELPESAELLSRSDGLPTGAGDRKSVV